jgi:hypothetical protein
VNPSLSFSPLALKSCEIGPIFPRKHPVGVVMKFALPNGTGTPSTEVKKMTGKTRMALDSTSLRSAGRRDWAYPPMKPKTRVATSRALVVGLKNSNAERMVPSHLILGLRQKSLENRLKSSRCAPFRAIVAPDGTGAAVTAPSNRPENLGAL